jgi:predicted metal-dependent HD superfamily phosphohydrolase
VVPGARVKWREAFGVLERVPAFWVGSGEDHRRDLLLLTSEKPVLWCGREIKHKCLLSAVSPAVGLSHMSEFTQDRWLRLWRAATSKAPPPEYYERLVALYSEPHRRYHNVRHIDECLHEYDLARHVARQPVAVELAIWFHDAVYDLQADDNEERSAELAQDWLKEHHASDTLGDAVGRLVLATKHHDATGHVDAPLVVDADLSILGQTQPRFWEYEAQIGEEYTWMDQTAFATKRADLLERLAARQRIYTTDWFFRRYEPQARMNLRQAISKLRLGEWLNVAIGTVGEGKATSSP